MCLILFAIQPSAEFKLVVAANRDEFYARPSLDAHFWKDQPNLLAGKDLEMGGTWLGLNRNGRFAAVTNFRETPANPAPPRSRGELTLNFLSADMPAADYLETLKQTTADYRGYNLLLGDDQGIFYYNNRQSLIRKLDKGYYGLSNQLLNCDWPKVSLGKQKLNCLSSHNFDKENMFQLLFDKGDDEAFSSSFITSVDYGTCASTILTVGTNGSVLFEERNFVSTGVQTNTNTFTFELARTN